jgi:hypothetical protein
MLKPNDHVLDYVDDYLHEVLSPADAMYVERHGEQCQICKVALEEARKRFAALENVPTSEASGHLIQATLAKITDHERRRSSRLKLLRWGLVPTLAASIIFIASLHLYYLNLSATPYDLHLYGQTELLAGTNSSLRVRLINHQSGTAIANVPVDIELRDPTTNHVVALTQFTTDAQGSGQPRFQLPDWVNGKYELRVVAHPSRTPEVITRTIQLKRSWKLMLSSDKPVYQPGRTIHVRSLALRRPDLKPVASEKVTFTIADPKGNVIFQRHGQTSKHGIAAIDCPLANEILEGPYAIACKVGDTDSKLTVDVRKYVLPKFKIDVDFDQPYYQPGQTVHGKVHAAYFFGKPVAEGPVEIEVRTKDVEANVYRRLTARTNQAGDASFDFAMPESLVGLPQEGGAARVGIQVTLTDSAGQKQSKSLSRQVTAEPLHIEVIPEAGSLVDQVPNTIYLYVSYPDGHPAQAQVEVSGVEQKLTSNSLGVAAFELTPRMDGGNLTIRATDAQGRIGRRHVELRWGAVFPDFLVRTDKAVYGGGESVRLVALGEGDQPVFVDFLKDGQTILTETIEMAKGRGEYEFDLPAELFGTVELCAYRFDAKGFPIRKTRALYIRQARQLNVKATLDRAEYRPGRQAQLQIALTNPQGKPTPGALSLAAVDEAVFSVLEQAPGMERTFYLLEQQLLQPIYAIYNWSPDLTTGTPPAERNQFEQALFARTLRTEGASQAAWQSLPRKGSAPAYVAPERPPHSLTASSFPTKEREIEQVRDTGLWRVYGAWAVMGAACLVAGYIFMWRILPTPLVIAVHVAFGFGVVAIIVGVSALGTSANRSFTALGSAVPARGEWAPAAGGGPYRKGLNEHGERSVPTEANKTPSPAVRVREWFPETLLWQPEVITDDQGRASVPVELADSITTWRLLASAVTADGRLGATQLPLRVFQPFFVDLNLPVALTRGDEVAIPVVLYNYLDKAQTVEITLGDANWFERLGEATQRLELAAGEVRSTAYRIRAGKVGNYQFEVTAHGSGVADAIKRAIEIVPDGRRVEQVFNGTLQKPAAITLNIPEGVIDGSAKAFLKIYPSSFSQLVEGLDAIFRMPFGCFEQTSSTTYPNVLALDYLRRTKKNAPEVEAKARQYIHLGYQRLLSFEVSGGGFDWFGRPPANRTLTAYGLMEFEDMAGVHDVDPRLIQRTRQWLLKQRNADGSWSPEGHGMHDDLTRRGQESDGARLSTTAYIAWAVFGASAREERVRLGDQARVTQDYLLSHRPETITDPHVLALVCNALLALDPEGREVQAYLDQLDSLKRTSEDGKRVWWEQAASAHTTFYGSGRAGRVETTALAALALLRAGINPGSTRGALTWLVEQKDASGTWRSTQATVLALKVLLAGTNKPLGGDQERRIAITLSQNGQPALKLPPIVIPADQDDVMQQIDLSEHLGIGVHGLTITEPSDTAAGYQVAFRYHVPGAKGQDQPEPLAIEIAYDRTELAVGDLVTATASVVNKMTQTAPMVILDLPIPAGFTIATEDLAKLVGSGSIAKYQVTPRTAIVYLRGLEPGKPLQLKYRLQAAMPVKVTAPSARVYEYYNADKQGTSRTTRLTVTQRP